MTKKFAAAPELLSQRLRLRGHRREDFEVSAAMWSDPEVVRFITKRPSTQAESWTRLLRFVGHWQLTGYGYWLIEDRTTGEFLGEIGLSDHKRPITQKVDIGPEMGWVLRSAAAGRGIATEAAQMVLAWAEEHLTIQTISCMMDPQNTASASVARKCGFQEWGMIEYDQTMVLLFQRHH